MITVRLLRILLALAGYSYKPLRNMEDNLPDAVPDAIVCRRQRYPASPSGQAVGLVDGWQVRPTNKNPAARSIRDAGQPLMPGTPASIRSKRRC